MSFCETDRIPESDTCAPAPAARVRRGEDSGTGRALSVGRVFRWRTRCNLVSASRVRKKSREIVVSYRRYICQRSAGMVMKPTAIALCGFNCRGNP